MIAGPSSLATASLAHPAPGATLTTSSTTHLLPSITTPQDLNIARVDYFADGQPIGYRTQPPFHHWRHLLAPGSYVLTAKITDDHGFTTTTAPVTVNIVNGAPSVVYYHADAAGSPVAATDQAGSLVWIEDYRPWGERNLSLESGTTNGLWYTGKPVEDATGLVYLGARWYSPEVGRFYSTDPISFREQEPKSFNRYAYGNNNPYVYVDPDGQNSVAILSAGRFTGRSLADFAHKGLAKLIAEFADHGYGIAAREVYFQPDRPGSRPIRIDGAFVPETGDARQVAFGEAKLGNYADFSKNQRSGILDLEDGKGYFYGGQARQLAEVLRIKPDANGRFRIDAARIQGVYMGTYDRSTDTPSRFQQLNEAFRSNGGFVRPGIE